MSGSWDSAVALYGDGDLEAARVAFAALVAEVPDDTRARRYLRWVEKAIEEGRAARRLNADGVRAVSEALAPWNEPADPVDGGRAVGAPNAQAPADAPFPSPPTALSAAARAAVPTRLDEVVSGLWRPDATLAPAGAARLDDPWASPPALESEPPIAELPPPPAAPPASKRAPSAPGLNTLTGIPPLAQLTPLGTAGDESAALVADWYANPTGPNLPPLDVPELDDEQIAAIAALNEERGTNPGREPTLARSPSPTSAALDRARSPSSPSVRPVPPTGTIEGLAPISEFDLLETNPRQLVPTPPDIIAPWPPAHEPVHALAERGPSSFGEIPVDVEQSAVVSTFSPPSVEATPTYKAKPFSKVSTTSVALWPTDPVARTFAESEAALERGEDAQALALADEALQLAGGLTGDRTVAHLPALERIYRTLIGEFDHMLRVANARPADSTLDPSAAFLLSRIDGVLSVEDLLDVSGMPQLAAMRLLAQLIVRKMVEPA